MPTRRSKVPIRILSWNVNGLRACAKKGFLDWLKASRAEIVGLQEVRALPEQLARRDSLIVDQARWVLGIPRNPSRLFFGDGRLFLSGCRVGLTENRVAKCECNNR